jgi:hypothetical protein
MKQTIRLSNWRNSKSNYMQLSWQNNHNHSHYRIIQRKQSKNSLIRSIDSNQEAAVPSAVVVVAVKGEENGRRDGYFLMGRTASGTRDGGIMITTVGHADLISNTTA